MKSIISLSFLLTGFFSVAQDYSTGRILPQAEQDIVFTDSVKKTYGIAYPILRVYGFTDNSGQMYLVLTEKQDPVQESDSIHTNIQVVQLQQMKNRFLMEWEMNDSINPEKEESAISFWTRYTTVSDLDGDGWTDPVIVYGTMGMNGTDDGRLEILVYYKRVKIRIRHQNGVLDSERITQVDKAFYKLPAEIRQQVKSIMEKMQENNHAIFPGGWQDAMKKKKQKFDEN